MRANKTFTASYQNSSEQLSPPLSNAVKELTLLEKMFKESSS